MLLLQPLKVVGVEECEDVQSIETDVRVVGMAKLI